MNCFSGKIRRQTPRHHYSLSPFCDFRKMPEKQRQIIHPSGAPNRVFHGISNMAAWPFSGLCRASDPTLFHITLLAAFLPTILGNCGPPPFLPFAFPISELNQTEFSIGTILSYSCRPGYSRSSSSQILTCKSSGEWHYKNFCAKKRCSYPGDLPNGQVEIKTDLLFGSQIEFRCLEGYILIGSPTSRCESRDKGVFWSDPLPECMIAKCAPPPAIINGKHSGGDQDFYTYGASVTYRCDPNFSLLGNASISCTVVNNTMGTWSSSPPTCKKINCDQPHVPHGNIVSGFGPIYNYKDSIVFTCQKDFVLRGSSLIHCEADSNWRPPPPVCEPSGCTDLPDIPHAYWRTHLLKEEVVYPVGSVLKYNCRAGYHPATNEPMIVTCQKDFRWSPFKGCKETCCPRPELKNMRILHHRVAHPESNCAYFYQDELIYTCLEKQEFKATCKSDGTWYPETPSCDHSCSSPPDIAHGRSQMTSWFFKIEVTYECDEGYQLVGQAKLSCDSSQWSAAAPQCKALCLKPEIQNGKLSEDKDQYVESEKITIHCDSGFAVAGLQSITCSENRTWYPKVPKCEWEFPEDCEDVNKGSRLLQCLPNPKDVKMALDIFKLSLDIELLRLQIDRMRLSILE
uniref:C4b-binding protein alpha chain isoform X2 n=1 Tax=Jaculus jaculus TaxID=51337 RepID=UPI001E1B2415|nr:C4b-binding protein alpha chain isoform X2 [Jaculus jaculus]